MNHNRPQVSAGREADAPANACDDSPELSIVIPCLNEAGTIATCIAKARRFLEQHRVAGEIIIADNGSNDGSADIARDLGVIVHAVATPGYGAALMGGFARASGRFIIFADGDDSYDFEHLMPFLARLREGDDFVIGDRFGGSIETGAMPFLHRYLGNPLLSSLGRLLYKTPINDFHCGLRGIRRDALARLKLRATGMEFASEMIVKAGFHKLKISQVPITLYADGRGHASHLRTWRDGWRHLRFLMIHSPRWLFFYPGLVTLFVGLCLLVWLLPGARAVGGLTLDVHTMLYGGVMTVVGLQLVSFALFSWLFTANAGLLPREDKLLGMVRTLSLERGILFGSLLGVAGLATSVYALLLWSDQSYGNLVPAQMMRLTIPAVTAMACGAQVVFTSFFLSVLRLGEY